MNRSTPASVWRRARVAAVSIALLAVLATIATLGVSRALGYNTYVIYGSSMEPAIELGSLVVATPAGSDELEVGDIVVFKSPSNGVTVTHRIVDIVEQDDSRYLRTKGDASPGDDPLQLDPAIGVRRVVFHVPYLGFAVNFAKSPLGIILFVVAPALALLATGPLGGRRPANKGEEATGEA